ncbi:chalcone isomerase family protein [Flavobacterium sp. N3904]|uniref:chalcone isomerase family protein n=1 Tax=Flavobacterium sp. N3904 TaxID=2986835 RepID=UPI00222582FC|nr:chalcone isomerase family protein [Flavobacterium sp. N3904]
MKKIFLVAILLISSLFSEANAQKQIDYEGVTLPRTIAFEGRDLQLNGFGSRTKFWTEVYIQALYLSNLSDNATDILNSDTNMAIRLQITSSLVSSKKLSKALQKGIVKSIGEENVPKFQTQLDLLEKLLNREDTNKNDNFNLIYTPIDKSIWVYKNNVLEGKIPGFEFKKAFFGIWLSNNPVDEELKNSLLGH